MGHVDRFLALCEHPGAVVPLDELCFRLAGCFRRGLDVEVQRRRLDELADLVQVTTVGGVVEALYGAGGLRGNEVDYYDPANSLLDVVLTRRTGIPLSLAVVLIEVGRRVGVEVVGVGMPGHFLARAGADPQLFVDPFTGALFDRRGCEALWVTRFGPAASFDPAWLEPTASVEIVARMVANLEHAFRLRGDTAGTLTALEVQAGLPQISVEGRKAAARKLAQLGSFDRAAAVLERLAQAPGVDGRRRDDLLGEARSLLARLN